MCIRDSLNAERAAEEAAGTIRWLRPAFQGPRPLRERGWGCLLYTSDAADERSSVDLGGRRIIKKKKDYVRACRSTISQKHTEN